MSSVYSTVCPSKYFPLNLTRDRRAQMDQDLVWATLDFTVDGTSVTVSCVRRSFDAPYNPILILHGFGSTKEDFLDISLTPSLRDVPFILYDAPGSGHSTCQDPKKLSIPFLVRVAEKILDHHQVRRFHLVGHSMGGLTALKLAQKRTGDVISFVNIKGNLAPEDCFLSRQILEYPSNSPAEFMSQFIERVRRTPQFGSALYAAALPAKVHAEAARPIFQSMVHISDNEPLLDIFEGLSCRRVFMYGEQYRSLSYLGRLSRAGIELAEIQHAGHFIMHTNPIAMWQKIAQLTTDMEATAHGH